MDLREHRNNERAIEPDGAIVSIGSGGGFAQSAATAFLQSGARLIGKVSTEGYTYEESKSVIDGKTRDFELLVKKYQLRIISLCQKYTKNYHDAEEVSQEAFVKAINSLSNFRFESKFYSWLHRIAINCSLNYINSKEKKSIALLHCN